LRRNDPPHVATLLDEALRHIEHLHAGAADLPHVPTIGDDNDPRSHMTDDHPVVGEVATIRIGLQSGCPRPPRTPPQGAGTPGLSAAAGG